MSAVYAVLLHAFLVVASAASNGSQACLLQRGAHAQALEKQVSEFAEVQEPTTPPVSLVASGSEASEAAEQVTPPNCSTIVMGDRFIQLGDWRLADMDGKHFSISHANKKTSVIFRRDGTVHSGWGSQDWNSWSRSTGEAKGIKFGFQFIQIGKWRIGAVDEKHLSMAHEDGGVSCVWRQDATFHFGNLPSWSTFDRSVGEAEGIRFGDRFIQIGDFRFGDLGEQGQRWFGWTNSKGENIQLLRSDGKEFHAGGGSIAQSELRRKFDLNDRPLSASTCKSLPEMAEGSSEGNSPTEGSAEGNSPAEGSTEGTSHTEGSFNTSVAPNCSTIVMGDRFIQLGDWRLADMDGSHLSISHANQLTSVIFRKDGTVHSGLGSQDWNSWSRSRWEAKDIKFGFQFIQIGKWRIGAVDEKHLSMAHEDGGVSCVWRQDATFHLGNLPSWSTFDRSVGEAEGIRFGDRFIQIGDFRFGDLGEHGKDFFGWTNRKGENIQLLRSDGKEIHPGGSFGQSELRRKFDLNDRPLSASTCKSLPEMADGPQAAERGCLPPTTFSGSADGIPDNYRGWYDVQGCGQCWDYCRWAGNSGSGGDPQSKLSFKQSWWSCRLAGTSSAQSPNGTFQSWNFERCSGEAAIAPSPSPPPTPYVPGEPGAAWTAQEVAVVKAKLQTMMLDPGRAMAEADFPIAVSHRYEPNPAKVLRLAFHDCMKYKDGTGGCDGCLDWWGVGRRSVYADDGHNNGLYVVAECLEHIYTWRDYPRGTPLLNVSLQNSNKSRADLWALAGMVAVEAAMYINNLVCDADHFGAHGQFNTRWNHSDCRATAPRSFVFKTGRRDCSGHPFTEPFEPALKGIKRRGYMTSKRESHPDPHADAKKTTDYFKKDFDFNEREVVAIMGAHTIGTFHVEIAGFKYNWKFSHRMFNNGYYRLLSLKHDWAPTGIAVNGKRLHYKDIHGNYPGGSWVAEVWHQPRAGGGQVRRWQVLKKKRACTPCDAPPGDGWWSKSSVIARGLNHQKCCTNLEEGKFCKSECVKSFDDAGIHESMLASDIGLRYPITLANDGLPRGCTGGITGPIYCWDKITPITGDIVEEFAGNQTSWLADFFDAYEKMVSNGYAADELTEALADPFTEGEWPMLRASVRKPQESHDA
ncbi:APX1 [Symbiodinium natans]|uniref:APX1 protein n=1 Tax=Symbiodinium natans TaxID=878477 RepID=A0A812QL38_9DINO|nr:APX1 [Symbiodinium natans]